MRVFTHHFQFIFYFRCVEIPKDRDRLRTVAIRFLFADTNPGELSNSSSLRHNSFNYFNKSGIDPFICNYSFPIYADKCINSTNMKNKLQAAISFIGAPCLAIDFYRHANGGEQSNTSVLTNILDILYMAGWICTMFRFIRMRLNGSSKAARILLYLQLFFLFLAGSSDIVTILKIPVPGNLFFYWDLFWPLSNCLMLVTGISIVIAGRLHEWKRWIPLMAGLWLPVTLLVKFYLSPEYMAYIGGTYSLLMWTLMAYIAHTSAEQRISSYAVVGMQHS